jgi:hypothetical protein
VILSLTVVTVLITRTYKAVDACGNDAFCYQIFTWKVDTTDPVLEDCPTPTLAYQCYADVPTPADVKAFDTCDGVLDVVFTETQSDTLSSCAQHHCAHMDSNRRMW